MSSSTTAALSSRRAGILAATGLLGSIVVGSIIAFLTPLSTSAATGEWSNVSIPAQTMTAIFDAKPTVNKGDVVIGLSQVQADAYADLATIVRFNNTGTIDARNGSIYAAAATVPYSAGNTYRFRIVVNITAKTYSVFVTSPGKTEVSLASSYAFRSDQSSVTSLNYLSTYASVGDVGISNLTLNGVSVPTSIAPTPTPSPSGGSTPAPSTSSGYDSVVLEDKPVMFLTMANGSTGSEPDKSGNGRNGTYKNGVASTATMPNGDKAAVFDGSSDHLTVASHSSLSIPTTKKMTWEAWIRPDTLQFPKSSSSGYVDWMGKCHEYSPNCEWEARMYNQTNPQGRTSRLSAYAFNPTAGLGSGANWQPASSNVIKAGEWLHVVGQYDLTTTPSGCNSAYPGKITIWVNGIEWSQKDHMPTGCMSQYKITPKAGDSPLNVATMAYDTFFKGAIGKVAVYNRLLTASEIKEHFTAMTGKLPTGSCGDTCHF